MEIMKIFQQCFFIILVKMIKNEIFPLFYGTNNCLKCWVLFQSVGLFIGGSYHSLSEEKTEIKFYLKIFISICVA